MRVAGEWYALGSVRSRGRGFVGGLEEGDAGNTFYGTYALGNNRTDGRTFVFLRNPLIDKRLRT